jgi:hypothetical protein
MAPLSTSAGPSRAKASAASSAVGAAAVGAAAVGAANASMLINDGLLLPELVGHILEWRQ